MSAAALILVVILIQTHFMTVPISFGGITIWSETHLVSRKLTSNGDVQQFSTVVSSVVVPVGQTKKIIVCLIMIFFGKSRTVGREIDCGLRLTNDQVLYYRYGHCDYGNR